MDLRKAATGKRLVDLRYSKDIREYYKKVQEIPTALALSSLAWYDIKTKGKYKEKVKQAALHIMDAKKSQLRETPTIWESYVAIFKVIYVGK